MEIPRSLGEEAIIDHIKESFGLTDAIASALEQAKKSHKNQYREDGEPYLTEHIYPVTKLVIDFFGDQITEKAIISSLLHDALEDDRTLTDNMVIQSYGKEVHQIIKSLSKPNLPELESLSERERRDKLNKKYFELLSASSYEAKVIKLIDRIDNLFWAMTFGVELVKIYVKETKEFFLPLAKEIDDALYDHMHYLLSKLENEAKKKNWI